MVAQRTFEVNLVAFGRRFTPGSFSSFKHKFKKQNEIAFQCQIDNDFCYASIYCQIFIFLSYFVSGIYF